jgi:hypothetical protein
MNGRTVSPFTWSGLLRGHPFDRNPYLTEKTMTDEKNVTPVVAPVVVISQAMPAMVDATKGVVPAVEAAPVLSQAPAMTAADVKPVVDKVGSIAAPILFDKK